MKRFLIVLLLAALLVPMQATATATSGGKGADRSPSAARAGGSLTCAKGGRVTPTVHHQLIRWLKAHVKKAGPPGGTPTRGWSVSAKPASPPDFHQNFAFVSPYTAGTWGASSQNGGGPDWSAHAQCTRRAAPSARPVATRKLGYKKCPAGKTVVVRSGALGRLWMSYRSTASTPVHRVAFPGTRTYVAEQALETSEREVFAVTLRAYRYAGSDPEQWFFAPKFYCHRN